MAWLLVLLVLRFWLNDGLSLIFLSKCVLTYWLDCSDRSRHSSPEQVQDVWEVYFEMLRLPAVNLGMSGATENGLLLLASSPFSERGKAVLCTGLVGGRAPGEVHRGKGRYC